MWIKNQASQYSYCFANTETCGNAFGMKNAQSMPSNSDPALGQRIRALIKRLGESQSVFGERFDVQQATVSRWVAGWVPAREYWEPLSKLAGQTVAEFILGEPPRAPTSKSGPSGAEVLAIFRALLPVVLAHQEIDRQRAEDLTQILLEAVQSEPLEAAAGDRMATAKILAELALRRLDGRKPQ